MNPVVAKSVTKQHKLWYEIIELHQEFIKAKQL